MDLENPDDPEDRKGIVSPSCSICLESVFERGDKSIARLQCGHEFHLDCIGSAFNAKGSMQCPNCRKIEKGRWLYANGLRPSSDVDFEGWMSENIYDLSYSELPFGLQWCPFRGFTQLTTLSEDGEAQPNSYHEPFGSNTLGELLSASTATQACPYLALHQAMHVAHSGASISIPETAPFHRHPSNLGVQPSSEMLNSHNFSSTEAHNASWPQLSPALSIHLVGNSDHAAAPYGLRLSRNDTSNQQRLGSFVHAHPLRHGSIPARSGSNLLASSMGPPIMRDVRSHTRGHGQSVSSPSIRASAFVPIRRSRPRGISLISTTSTIDIGALYGFSVSGSTGRSHQDSDRRYYGWGRESFTPLPWIPVEGESQWWGPFNPNHTPQFGSFLQRAGSSGELIAQNHSDNGYHQQIPLPPWMPPPPYM